MSSARASRSRPGSIALDRVLRATLHSAATASSASSRPSHRTRAVADQRSWSIVVAHQPAEMAPAHPSMVATDSPLGSRRVALPPHRAGHAGGGGSAEFKTDEFGLVVALSAPVGTSANWMATSRLGIMYNKSVADISAHGSSVEPRAKEAKDADHACAREAARGPALGCATARDSERGGPHCPSTNTLRTTGQVPVRCALHQGRWTARTF